MVSLRLLLTILNTFKSVLQTVSINYSLFNLRHLPYYSRFTCISLVGSRIVACIDSQICLTLIFLICACCYIASNSTSVIHKQCVVVNSNVEMCNF